jgi:archaellum biogenesis ATPase FlaH
MALDALSLYGSTFQIKVVACLMTKLPFLSQVYDMLDPTYFEVEAVAELVKIIKDRYHVSHNITTLEIFKIEISKIRNAILSEAMTDKLKDATTHFNDSDLDYVQTEFITFCKNQAMKKAIMDSVDLLKEGRYDEIFASVREALKVGTERNVGLEYENPDTVRDRLITKERTGLIETPWPVLNEILDGGMSAGDLGILIGNAGSGKSWVLTSLGLHALKMNKNVLHFTLELSEEYTSKRYDARLTGINSANLKYHVDEVEESIKKHIKGKLSIKFYPTKSVTVNTLRSVIEKAILINRKPDLIIVDYGDLIKSDNPAAIRAGSYHESGTIYEELRGLAGEFQVPVWTASQSHRGSGEKDIITGEDVSDSYKKIMIADFVVSISRKTADKLQDTARWHIIKNRYGVDGITFPGRINASIGNIEIFSPTSIQGTETKKIMQTGNEAIRKELSKKFKEFNDFEDDK